MTLVLTASDTRQAVNPGDALKAARTAFLAHESGKGKMVPKLYLQVPRGDFRAMPSLLGPWACIKWINVHPGNPKRGRPSIYGTVILNDAATGEPRAVMDGSLLTKMRTAAASALAARTLGRRDSRTLGVVGCGAQAPAQVEAFRHAFRLREILLADRGPGKAETLARRLGPPARPATIEEAAGCDLLVTVTPARGPVVRRQWVRPGTHISAIGADGPGKQELDPALLRAAKVVVDDPEQAEKGGEINVPVSRGLYSIRRVHGTLGQVLAGKRPGRTSRDEITLFDSTGLALQDVALAAVIHGRARRKGLGREVDFLR